MSPRLPPNEDPDLRAQLREAYQELRAQAQEIGRLSAIAARVDELEAKSDRVVGELAAAQARVRDLEAGGRAAFEAKEVATDVFAGELRSMFERLSVPQPEPGRQTAAALTSFEVEARGVLLPPEAEGAATRFVAVDPTTGAAEALSTVRMRFGLLPQVPPAREG